MRRRSAIGITGTPCRSALVDRRRESRADDRLGGRRHRDHRPDRAARRDRGSCGCTTVRGAGRRDSAGWPYGVRRRSAWPGRSAWRWPPGCTPTTRPRWPPRYTRVETARPTAVNLARGARRAAAGCRPGRMRCWRRPARYATRRSPRRTAMAARGADLLVELCGDRPRLLTHCNTGALATVTGGTALGVVVRAAPPGALAGWCQRDPSAAAGRPADRVGAGPGGASRTGSPSTAPGRS